MISPASSSSRSYGAVFTKRWVVDLMLDLAGYSVERDLVAQVAHEPSVGDGAFLLPMVERLSRSCREHGLAMKDAGQSIRAWDLQIEHVDSSRTAVETLLVNEGWNRRTARRLASEWVIHSDYLLREADGVGANFVIGNPPYIRAESIPRELRTEYLSACPTMTPGADVFVGFIEQGLRSLVADGVLCFICADRWMHNSYGRKLRTLVTEQFSVDAILKMHGVDAFAEEVAAYPAVTIIRRDQQRNVVYAEAKSSFDEHSADRVRQWSTSSRRPLIDDDVAAAILPSWFSGGNLWPAGSPARLRLLDRLEQRFSPLQNRDTGTRVGIGIATGADRVFISTSPDVVEPDRLVPLVKSAHLSTGTVEWSDTWLVNPWNSDGSLVDLDSWPRLREHFDNSSASLKNRHVAKRAKSDWYRTIDKIRPGLAATPKLLFQDMKRTSEPVLDEGGFYPHHNLYWITSSEWDLRELGGLLLSRVAQLFIEAYAVKMRGGTLRFQAQYLRKIRTPNPAKIPVRLRRRLARAFEKRDADAATSAAVLVYGINAKEWEGAWER